MLIPEAWQNDALMPQVRVCVRLFNLLRYFSVIVLLCDTPLEASGHDEQRPGRMTPQVRCVTFLLLLCYFCVLVLLFDIKISGGRAWASLQSLEWLLPGYALAY